MCKIQKAKDRLKSRPKDYSFDEATSLLQGLGFFISHKGKTSGSRIKFVRQVDGLSIILHKPHPSNIMKHYMVSQLYDFLVEIGGF